MWFEQDVYREAVELRAGVVRAIAGRGSVALHERFERASGGVIAYLAQGADAAEQRPSHVAARARAFEMAETLVRLRLRAELTAEQYATAKQLMISVLRMLTSLCEPPVATGAGVRR